MRTFSSEFKTKLGFLLLAFVTLWGQVENEMLRSVDGACYAVLGKQLSIRPIYQWIDLRINGSPFFEHPPLTPWILALSMKLFGVSNMSAILPIVLLSTLTVTLTYQMGKILLDHRFGILAASVLALTPAFVKDGRNPMLEPALMFTIMLSLYFHLRFHLAPQLKRFTLYSGLAFGAAILAKGPPAVLVPAVILTYSLFSLATPLDRRKSRATLTQVFVHLLFVVLIGLALVGLVDVWSRLLMHASFFAQYLNTQLKFTIVQARGATVNQYWFYKNNLTHYYPWVYFMAGAVILSLTGFFKKNVNETWRKPWNAFLLSSLTTGGIFLGFTLMTHKGWWYTNFHYASSSLLAAIPLWIWCSKVTDEKFSRVYFRVCVGVTALVLSASATFPSWFQYPRPFEQLLLNGQKKFHEKYAGQKVANCIDAPEWAGTNELEYYLSLKMVPCADPQADLALVTLNDPKLPVSAVASYISVMDPVALVQLNKPHPSP
jgi:4-amino-4-deoxy-L-arabinose transferase-like glycosyltransferase